MSTTASPTVTKELLPGSSMVKIIDAIGRPDIFGRHSREDRIAHVFWTFMIEMFNQADPSGQWMHDGRFGEKVYRLVGNSSGRLEALIQTLETRTD